MPPAKSDSFTSSFPIWICLIYLLSLTAVSRTSKTIWIVVEREDVIFPFLISLGILSYFSIENDVHYGFDIDGLYYAELGSLRAHFL